jgi:hypothetical protein
MNDIIQTSREIPLPVRSEVSVRPAVASDLAFIDSLQRMHSDGVGWMQTKALETKIERCEIIVAEQGGRQIGYCMGQDRYFKHEDVGIIYQMNIVPGHQRGLVGATLLKAQFERSAYGCKLYCCWCAQDIAANRFWEAMGFIPLAFRAGSRGKQRVHIFWQRRIRSGDETTPYWFPSQTGAGALKEDRIVLPIPPGTHWSEVRPTVLPSEEFAPENKKEGEKREKKAVVKKPQARMLGAPLWFAPPVVEKPKEAKVKEPKKKVKNDPKLIVAARELRDRWLEQVNAAGGNALLVGNGKYDVSRPALSGVEGMIGVAEVREGFFVGSQHVKQITAIAA